MIEVLIIILVALLVCTNFFWSRVCLKLTDRLMSKNYWEFVQAESSKRPVQTPKVPVDNEPDLIAESHAREMNSLIGVF